VARMTAADKQIETKLREYFEANEAKRKADADYRRTRKMVEDIPDGQYGSMLKTFGNPRTINDNDAITKRFDQLGEIVPTKQAFPLVVREVQK
jgi:hypothetical protein